MLEFQARAAYPNNLQSAAALVEEIGNPQLGLCLDVFHFFTGASKEADLAYLAGANLFHVQLCDLAGQARVRGRREPRVARRRRFRFAVGRGAAERNRLRRLRLD